MFKKEVSIIMVNWKVADLVIDNVRGLFENTKNLDLEVIVVDNNSEDGVEDKLKNNFPQQLACGNLKFIQAGSNLGFAKANNLGVQCSTGEYLLFMNPDMKVLDNSIYRVYQYYLSLNLKDRGALGGKLLFPDRTVQPTVKNNPTFWDQSLVLLKLHHFLYKYWPLKKYFALDFDYEKNQKVKQLMGAFIFIDKKVFEKIGGWPEVYWIWWEDVDLCKQLQQAGYQNYYYSKTQIIHYEGKSFAKELSLRKQSWFVKSMLIYFSRHLKWYQYWQFLLLLILTVPSFIFTALIQLLPIKSKGQAKVVNKKNK